MNQIMWFRGFFDDKNNLAWWFYFVGIHYLSNIANAKSIQQDIHSMLVYHIHLSFSFSHNKHSNKYCMCCSFCCFTFCHSFCFIAEGLRHLHPSPLCLTSAINNSAKECTELKMGGVVVVGAVDGFSWAHSISPPLSIRCELPHFLQ